MIEGFCISHKDDVPVSASRWCPEHQTLCLPPSWSSQNAVYPEWPPRPADYVYAPRQLQESKAAPRQPLGAARKPFTRRAAVPVATHPVSTPDALTCHQCRQTYAQGPRTGGPDRRFCGSICRAKAAQRIRRGLAPSPKIVTCVECGKTADAVPSTGGMRRRYCSAECGRKRNNRRNNRAPMVDRGMRCEDCGRDDRPHKGRGLCSACWAKAWRRSQEVAA